MVKKTELAAYNTPLKADGIIAIKMREKDDELVSVRHSSGGDDILMVSRKGQAIRFSEQEVRPMGRDTAGVKGMGLRKGDEVISVNVIGVNEGDLLVVTVNGYGKRTKLADYPRKGRARARREDGAADRGARAPGRSSHRARRLPGDADLERRHGDQDPGRRHQAARAARRRA